MELFSKEWFSKNKDVILYFFNHWLFKYPARYITGINKFNGYKRKIIDISDGYLNYDRDNNGVYEYIALPPYYLGWVFSYKLLFLWKILHLWDILFANKYNYQYNLGFDDLWTHGDATFYSHSIWDNCVNTTTTVAAGTLPSQNDCHTFSELLSRTGDYSGYLYDDHINYVELKACQDTGSNTYKYISRVIQKFDTTGFYNLTGLTILASELSIYTAKEKNYQLGETDLIIVKVNNQDENAVMPSDFSEFERSSPYFARVTRDYWDDQHPGTIYEPTMMSIPLDTNCIYHCINMSDYTAFGYMLHWDYIEEYQGNNWNKNDVTGYYFYGITDNNNIGSFRIQYSIDEEQRDYGIQVDFTYSKSVGNVGEIITFNLNVIHNPDRFNYVVWDYDGNSVDLVYLSPDYRTAQLRFNETGTFSVGCSARVKEGIDSDSRDIYCKTEEYTKMNIITIDEEYVATKIITII